MLSVGGRWACSARSPPAPSPGARHFGAFRVSDVSARTNDAARTRSGTRSVAFHDTLEPSESDTIRPRDTTFSGGVWCDPRFGLFQRRRKARSLLKARAAGLARRRPSRTASKSSPSRPSPRCTCSPTLSGRTSPTWKNTSTAKAATMPGLLSSSILTHTAAREYSRSIPCEERGARKDAPTRFWKKKREHMPRHRPISHEMMAPRARARAHAQVRARRRRPRDRVDQPPGAAGRRPWRFQNRHAPLHRHQAAAQPRDPVGTSQLRRRSRRRRRGRARGQSERLLLA